MGSKLKISKAAVRTIAAGRFHTKESRLGSSSRFQRRLEERKEKAEARRNVKKAA